MLFQICTAAAVAAFRDFRLSLFMSRMQSTLSKGTGITITSCLLCPRVSALRSLVRGATGARGGVTVTRRLKSSQTFVNRGEKVGTDKKTSHRLLGGVLGTAFGCTAALHSAEALGMAGKSIDLTSRATDWKEAKRALENLTSSERRKFYHTQDFIPLEKIPPWIPPNDREPVDRRISLFRGDITRLELDAIVNAANSSLMGGGGVDGCIHRAAGPLLKKECATLGGCETGKAKMTSGYRLPAKNVIHTVGPIVHGQPGEQQKSSLRSCYWTSLDLAARHELKTLAFPCISTGIYGYPPDEAADIAIRTVKDYLTEYPDKFERVVFCVFLKSDETLYQCKLKQFLTDQPCGFQIFLQHFDE
ncbi:ADP-ribose glycohydrolase MACROD1 isoform X2 [Polypterus senegalus]|uniref:ADP-ribose glycohydrolase MACROD1 isoform X2 n=1 Tax=Polypterus senegalus TaxID=55291 RepID=UPI0019631954|nr:ADP-ribose glycohydrolase MACROD1 isoform X2 [Polypterus senegalus]